MRVEIFTGNTQNAFNLFLEGNQVDEIMLPDPYTFKNLNNKSFTPEVYIKNSVLPITKVEWLTSDSIPEKNSLAEIFLL